MMSTDRFITDDGVTLTYDNAGSGPVLILLHGQSQYRDLWHRYGWFSSLAADYTVITPDFRGTGDSDVVHSVAGHALERYVSDIHEVLDHAGLKEAAVWGWSFGGGVALRAASQSARIVAAVAAGARFGAVLSPELARNRLEDLDRLELATITGNWEGISDARRGHALITDFEGARARLLATTNWPALKPADIRRPALLIGGTEDSNSVSSLLDHQDAIAESGIKLKIVEGLNHVQLVEYRDTVEPIVRQFLSQHLLTKIPSN